MNKIIIPDHLIQLKYNARIIPNGSHYDLAKTGANCQVFAYALLRHYGYIVPDLRSSELWEDVDFSKKITANYQPFDILFFHKKEAAYGAHLAVYIGDNQAIHNAKKIGNPVIWDMVTFFEYPAYQYLLGGKRFKRQ